MYIQYTYHGSTSDQLCLSMDLEEDNAANHLVRVVNAARWIAEKSTSG